MNYFSRKILSGLIDKYERSVLSKFTVNKRLNVSLHFNKKEFSEYCDENSFKYIDDINNVCKYLEKENFLTIVYENNNKNCIDKVQLNLENVDQVYSYLNREKLSFKENRLIKILSYYQAENSFIKNFVLEMIDNINNHKSIRKYLDIDNIIDIQDILKALIFMVNQTTEILKRKFSILVFNNSKRFEQIENKVCLIIKDYYKADFETNEEVLSEFNIISNPSFVYFKGNGTFKINEQIIDLSKLSCEVSVSSLVIEKLEIININAKRVITIENLTTFYEYNNDNELIIYLGGYHNNIRRNLLLKIFNYNNNLNFIHFGDIDYGGFQILNHLYEKTNIHFATIYMDLETLIKYQDYAMKIDENYISKLQTLLKITYLHKYHNVINYMIENKIRLEQESIIL